MSRLHHYNLVVVGKSVITSDGGYYMTQDHWSHLAELAEKFDDAVFFTRERPNKQIDSDKMARIDESLMEIHLNTAWSRARTPMGKIKSLFDDVQDLRSFDPEKTITYSYFPGFYTFLLAPFVIRAGIVNAGFFGSDAVDTANHAYTESRSDTLRSHFYEWAQQYVLDSLDVIFVRDPTMAEYETDSDIVESKLITTFELPDESRKEPDIGITEPITLLYVAIFRPIKGHEHLISACEMLRDAGIEFTLVLVGDGEIKSDIETMVTERGLTDCVEFTGYIDDQLALRNQYRRADIFVMPSVQEGGPRVVLEATAMGLPVVTTTVGMVPYIFEDGQSALFVDRESPDSITSAVHRLLENDSLAETLVRNAKDRIAWYYRDSAANQHAREIESKLSSRTN